MIALMAICGLAAIVGGVMYLLITVGSVFLGKKIETPGFAHVKAKDGVAPTPRPVEVAFEAHGTNIGRPDSPRRVPSTLAMVFLVSFILYYFVNWKYLSTVWPLS